MKKEPSHDEKTALWKAYTERKPLRVPLRWNVNTRIIVLNPALNPEGFSFEQVAKDPQVAMTVQSRFIEYLATTLSHYCDVQWTIPEAWWFWVETHNTYDAAYFGAPVRFNPGQVACTETPFNLDDVDDFLARDFSNPLKNVWLMEQLHAREVLDRAAQSFTYAGRKGTVGPFTLGFDGPLTVATNLFGEDIFVLLGMDPPKARELLLTITRAVILRNRTLSRLAGEALAPKPGGWMADNSVQLISTEMLEEVVLPAHKLWFNEMFLPPTVETVRACHLCGDATRHFPLLARELGITSFDTGFPVNHGALRKVLGPDVEICGGPEISLLMQGTPEACAARTRQILHSGVMEGGRFLLQEGNNLPPCAPLKNLSAVYETCLTDGVFQA